MRKYAEYQQLVEENLVRQMESLGETPRVLREAMAYSLTAGGKRIRPVLLLAACDLLGGSMQEALPFACALEMIHTYSLIHDDLPAMDNDDLRRGKPTNHKVYGEDVAILAGDGLLSAAMELMICQSVRLGMRGIRAAEAIARRAGVTGMIAGQTVDVTSEGATPTLETVRYIHAHKTADLLTAPMEAGLILGGGTREQIEGGCEYAYHLGLAFQMVDDLLDVEGDEKVLGKSIGKDAAEQKMTWVAVRGLTQTRQDAQEHIDEAVKCLSKLPEKGNFFKTLAESTLNRVQ